MSGGENPVTSNVETWNGSAWTETTNMPIAKAAFDGAGTGSLGVVAGGYGSPGTPTAISEEWVGAGANVGAWSSGGNLNSAKSGVAGAGTQTAGIVFGGSTGSATGVTQTYDGSSFSTNPATMNVARTSIKSGLNGSQTSTVAFGGSPPQTNATEDWDGTTWTTSTALPATVQSHGGAGTGASALSFGGTSPDRADTYEYTSAGTATIKTVTTS